MLLARAELQLVANYLNFHGHFEFSETLSRTKIYKI